MERLMQAGNEAANSYRERLAASSAKTRAGELAGTVTSFTDSSIVLYMLYWLPGIDLIGICLHFVHHPSILNFLPFVLFSPIRQERRYLPQGGHRLVVGNVLIQQRHRDSLVVGPVRLFHDDLLKDG